jgi:hypothetical protein
MAEDRHLHKPKSVRIPGGLLAWLAEQATMEGRKPNAVIVAALEEYRANHGGGIAPSRPQMPHEETFTDLREYSACRHPAELVEAGECRGCGADVW